MQWEERVLVDGTGRCTEMGRCVRMRRLRMHGGAEKCRSENQEILKRSETGNKNGLKWNSLVVSYK